ncbi:hypothetical protein HK105_202253 [Polyrhizophydium stewartii]|uniref:PH domain-containing protein n=1 Tax=Polyrhizophydium stewartii TaxID=2732419 RepID=A0ABR4NFP8_9FUNG
MQFLTLPSGAAMFSGLLTQRKLTVKSRRQVVLCMPVSTADVQAVHDELALQAASRSGGAAPLSSAASAAHSSSTLHRSHVSSADGASAAPSASRSSSAASASAVAASAAAAGDSAVGDLSELVEQDMDVYGHIALSAISGYPLLVIGTSVRTFIHFSQIEALLDETELQTPCAFAIVTAFKEFKFYASTSTDYQRWMSALTQAFSSLNDGVKHVTYMPLDPDPASAPVDYRDVMTPVPGYTRGAHQVQTPTRAASSSQYMPQTPRTPHAPIITSQSEINMNTAHSALGGSMSGSYAGYMSAPGSPDVAFMHLTPDHRRTMSRFSRSETPARSEAEPIAWDARLSQNVESLVADGEGDRTLGRGRKSVGLFARIKAFFRPRTSSVDFDDAASDHTVSRPASRASRPRSRSTLGRRHRFSFVGSEVFEDDMDATSSVAAGSAAGTGISSIFGSGARSRKRHSTPSFFGSRQSRPESRSGSRSRSRTRSRTRGVAGFFAGLVPSLRLGDSGQPFSQMFSQNNQSATTPEPSAAQSPFHSQPRQAAFQPV